MTERERTQHITAALAQYATQSGTKETLRLPLRGSMTVEVIEVPLDLPVLNTDSFRIAPALEDHPKAQLVKSDPYGFETQAIVAELVRGAHRQAEELKGNLKTDGQDQPGVITRKGKLLNANTRCVLLRELHREGDYPRGTIRVAVLPGDVTQPEELQLESILQKQREYKDEYNLVSELMMLDKLHRGANMTPLAIAKQQRIRGGEARVRELLNVLILMDRARKLTDPVLPLSAFISKKDQTQNWVELLRTTTELDQKEGTRAGDAHVRRWLLTFYAGHGSVHKLRFAKGEWVEELVLPELSDRAESGDSAAAQILDGVRESVATASNDVVPVPDGLSFLGDDDDVAGQPEGEAEVGALLNLVAQMKASGDGDVELPSGAVVGGDEIREVLAPVVKRALDEVKRRAAAGDQLEKPIVMLTEAQKKLSDVYVALEDVIEEPEFASRRDHAVVLAESVSELVDQILELLDAEVD